MHKLIGTLQIFLLLSKNCETLKLLRKNLYMLLNKIMIIMIHPK